MQVVCGRFDDATHTDHPSRINQQKHNKNMKKLFIVLTACAASLTACGNSATNDANENAQATELSENGEVAQPKSKTKLRNVSDSISYALGADYGRYLKNTIENLDGDVNIKMVFKSIRETVEGKTAMTESESFAFLQEYYTVILPERKLAEGQKFLEQVATQPNVQKTESGLLYEIIEPGDANIKATSLKDEVRVKYRGTLRDGREFDSNYENPEPAQFALNRVVRGWGEGLQLVGQGGKIKLYIPADLGYGKMGRRGTIIGPNEPLVFEIDLIEVIPAEPVEEAAE